MPNVSELISMGYGGYAGWGDTEANADFNATGGQGKYTGGGGGGGGLSTSSLPDFKFDEKAAITEAMNQLAPYYQKLLDMYGGDVALAKQRLDQDYERGLRVKVEDTEWQQKGLTEKKAERMRQFAIAMKDLNEGLNKRGIYTSGITEAEREKATADEQYQQGLITREEQQLAKELAQYKEQADVDYRRSLEEKGYLKPQTQNVAGTFAPSQAGVQTPNIAKTDTQMGFTPNISSYASEPDKKITELQKQRNEEVKAQAEAAYNRARDIWVSQIKQGSSLYTPPKFNV